MPSYERQNFFPVFPGAIQIDDTAVPETLQHILQTLQAIARLLAEIIIDSELIQFFGIQILKSAIDSKIIFLVSRTGVEHIEHAVGASGHICFQNVSALKEGGFIGGHSVGRDISAAASPVGGNADGLQIPANSVVHKRTSNSDRSAESGCFDFGSEIGTQMHADHMPAQVHGNLRA